MKKIAEESVIFLYIQREKGDARSPFKIDGLFQLLMNKGRLSRRWEVFSGSLLRLTSSLVLVHRVGEGLLLTRQL